MQLTEIQYKQFYFKSHTKSDRAKTRLGSSFNRNRMRSVVEKY